jgi:hypothetical protein
LLVKNFDKYSDLSSFICELKTVTQEIEENLFVPSLITIHFLNQIHVALRVDLSHQLNIVLIGTLNKNLECLVNGVTQIKVVFRQGKGIIFHLG